MTHYTKWLVLVINLTLATGMAVGAEVSGSVAPLPYRAVAASNDIYALGYNPAGLAFDTPVELAYLHQFSRIGPGGDNTLMLRAKTAAASVTWFKNRGLGKSRVYLLGGGHALSPNLSFGTTYRYTKSDDPAYNNKHTWTHSLLYRYSPMVTLGARWDNPWHTKILDVSTDGQITVGVSVKPIGSRLTASADWFFPDRGPIKDSFIRTAANVQISRRIELAGFIDGDGWVGVEFRWMRQRSAAGIEIRGDDLGNYSDGTMYLSVMDREYRPQQTPGLARIR